MDSKTERPSIIHINFGSRLAISLKSHCNNFCWRLCHRHFKGRTFYTARLIQCAVKIECMYQGRLFIVMANYFMVVPNTDQIYKHPDCYIWIVSVSAIYFDQESLQQRSIYISLFIAQVRPARPSFFSPSPAYRRWGTHRSSIACCKEFRTILFRSLAHGLIGYV